MIRVIARAIKIKHKKQSRTVRVKCRMNRELSPGRKENLAVHESHPAASEDINYLLL